MDGWDFTKSISLLSGFSISTFFHIPERFNCAGERLAGSQRDEVIQPLTKGGTPGSTHFISLMDFFQVLLKPLLSSPSSIFPVSYLH
jgi:hypothetical protein